MSVRAWNSSERLAFAALVTGMLASLAFLVHPWFEPRADASLYLLTAKALLAGEGFTYFGEPLIIRPPGFPLLLAPLVAWRGFDFDALNLYTSLWGVSAIALLFVWARPRLGWVVTSAVCICAWLNPAWQRMCNQTMSDVPGAALLIACLLIERWARAERSWKRDVVLGLAIGIGANVRAINLLLAPAIVIARVIEARRAGLRFDGWIKLAPLVLATGSALAPWALYTRTHCPPAPDMRISLYDYTTGMWRRDPSDPASQRLSPAELLDRTRGQTPQLLSSMGTRMAAKSRATKPMIYGALLLGCALFQLLRRKRVEGFFVLLAIGTLATYFDFLGRLLTPVWLIALIGLAELACDFGSRWMRVERVRAMTAAAFLLWAIRDAAPRMHWDRIEGEHRAELAHAARITALVPESKRIAVLMSGWNDAVYLQRPVWTLHFAWKRAGGAGIEQLLREQHVDTVVLRPHEDDPRQPSSIDPFGEERAWLAAHFARRQIAGDALILSE